MKASLTEVAWGTTCVLWLVGLIVLSPILFPIVVVQGMGGLSNYHSP